MDSLICSFILSDGVTLVYRLPRGIFVGIAKRSISKSYFQTNSRFATNITKKTRPSRSHCSISLLGSRNCQQMKRPYSVRPIYSGLRKGFGTYLPSRARRTLRSLCSLRLHPLGKDGVIPTHWLRPSPRDLDSRPSGRVSKGRPPRRSVGVRRRQATSYGTSHSKEWFAICR